MVGDSHPGIFQLIKIFRQEFLVDEIKIQRAALGQITTKKRKNIYIKKQKILKNLCESYDRSEKSIEDFLRAIGHNIRCK